MVPSARRPLRVRRWDGYALVSENRQNTSRLLTPGAQYRRRCHLLGPWTARRFRQTPLRTQHAYFGASAELVAYAEEEPLEEEPSGVVLEAAPNPANPAMAFQVTLPEAMQVELVIYNMLGQKVRTLVPFGPWLAGEHRVVWDGKNGQGLAVSTGVYVAKLRAGEQVKNRKVLILR